MNKKWVHNLPCITLIQTKISDLCTETVKKSSVLYTTTAYSFFFTTVIITWTENEVSFETSWQ